jgi:multicomponent Na+:H+ antiporter subunit C
MEAGLPLLVGLFVAGGVYLLLSRALIRLVLGAVLFSNGVILLIFTAGRLASSTPPVIPAGSSASLGAISNPLSQAFILTAIVIGFALFAFLAVLVMRAYQSFDADNTDHIRLSEPPGGPHSPLEY